MRSLAFSRRVLLAAVLSLGLSAAADGPQHLRTEPLVIRTHHGGIHFVVEVADTDQERETGLMFRTTLASDRGMLFDFKTPQAVQFWMKNTLIPLDMVFIDANGRVVSVVANAKPYDETPVPTSGPIEVLGVLEIAGGRAARADIEPGDRVIERMFPRP